MSDRPLGAIVLGNLDSFYPKGVLKREQEHLLACRERLATTPNHPYRFSQPTKDLLHAFAMRALLEEEDASPPLRDLVEGRLAGG